MSNAWLFGFLLVGCAGAATQPRTQPRIEDGSSASGSRVAGARPSPPADLDARLVRHDPLRGFVLSESGYAVVAFTVAPSGAVRVPEVLEASRPAYGDACRSMLEESTWTPAHDEHGQAVAFSGSFNCSFEHPHESAPRATSGGPAIATPPIQPDYGEKWFEQFSDEIADRDMGAVLEVEKQIRGAHWAAFEILPSGQVSRAEWVERPLIDEVLQACVFGVLREFRFAPAKERTIADVQLELGGVQRFGFRL